MPATWVRRTIQRLTGLCWSMLAVVIILTAVLVAAGRLLAPRADQLRPWIEQRLERETGVELSIERLTAQWPRLTPRLVLHGVRVGDPAEPEMEIDQAHIEVHLANLVLPARNVIRFALLGLDLAVIQDAAGDWDWRVEGGARLAAEQREPAWITGDFLLRDARVRLAPRDFAETRWHIPEAVFQRNGARVHLHAMIHPHDEPGTLELKLFADHVNGRIGSARAWLGGRQLPVSSWFARWNSAGVDGLDDSSANLQAWLEWTNGGIARVHGRFELERWPAADMRSGRRVAGLVLVERRGGEIAMEIAELSLDNRRSQPVLDGFAVGVDLDGGQRALVARHLDLGALHELLVPLFGDRDWFPETFAGRIDGLELGMSGQGSLHRLTGTVRELEMTPVKKFPGVAGLDLELGLAGDRAAVRPAGRPRVDWPAMLRQTVELESISGRVVLGPGAIELDVLEIHNPLVDAVANGFIWTAEDGPFLDFRIGVERMEPVDPRLWLPHGVIPEVAQRWLDQSLERVALATGDLMFHGRPADWPERMGPGSFSARVAFTGADLDYWPGWPGARELEGRVVFSGRGLDAAVEAGRVAGVDVRARRVHIPDMSRAVLELDLESRDSGAAALAQLASRLPAGPVFAHIGELDWHGPAHASARLILPIRDVDAWTLEGDVEFAGVDVADPELALALGGLSGVLPFSREQVGPVALSANIADEPVTIELDADLNEPARLNAAAVLPSAWLLLPDIAAWLPEDSWLEGNSRWMLQLSATQGGPVLELSSDLAGTAMDLPAPMSKDADEKLSFHMRLPLDPETGEPLALRMGERFSVLAQRDDDRWRLGLHWGTGEPELPESEQFLIRGEVGHLDLSGWARTLARVEFPEPGAFDTDGRIDLIVVRLGLGEQQLSDVDMRMFRDEGHWRLELEGPAVSGTLRLPAGPETARIVAAEFGRLHLPTGPETDEAEPADREKRTPFEVDPRRLPALHLLAEDLRWGQLELGRARVEAHASGQGLEFEQMEFDGPYLGLTGQGRWIWDDAGPVSDFELRLNSDDLSSLLRSAGIGTTLEAGRTRLELAARWPGAPSDFALASLDGVLDIHVQDGSIPEARPGPGRLVGLISLDALPRRLRLDFRDVFGAGLRFDSIEGRFLLAGGMAVTEGVVIDSPAAKITISGSTDLVRREYAQRVVVHPGLGATLPIIGALAGGPAGAAVGLALRSLLARPLRGVSEARYTVTGPWDDPTIELIVARPAGQDGDEDHGTGEG